MARLVVSLALLAAFTLPAWAGDRALFNPIGYSADAAYFAFEEYGISDGAGFAYASVYIVDLAKDTWVIGTPVKVTAQDETETLGAIRAKALADSAPQLSDLGIDQPAEMVALIGDGVPGADGTSLQFGVPSFLKPGAVDGDFSLRLATFEAEASAPCEEWFADTALGYDLTITQNGADRLIHHDENLPRSRGCPMAYRIYGVVLPFNAQTSAQGLAILSVYPHGFEGPDRRFLAVPLGQ